MEMKEKEALLAKKGSGTRIEQSAASDDVQITPSSAVYDKGESIVSKMNRAKVSFDKDEFFQDMFENYLICVERNEQRQHPESRIISTWNQKTTFEDFLGDSLLIIDKKLEASALAKAASTTRFAAIGDSAMNEIKLDAGSNMVGKAFNSEDYDAVYELLRLSKEAIEDYKADRISMVINQKTGRVRIGAGTAVK